MISVSRILVPVDYSGHAGHALLHAKHLASALRARVELVRRGEGENVS